MLALLFCVVCGSGNYEILDCRRSAEIFGLTTPATIATGSALLYGSCYHEKSTTQGKSFRW